MKYHISAILILIAFLATITETTADTSKMIKVLLQKFILEIYEDGVKKVDRYLYADLQIFSDKEAE